MFSKTGFVSALLGATAVQGHMLMNTPAPYGADSLNNSPLEADGSDFPCKQRDGVYAAASSENILNIGEANPLKFTGSATHGGGSCQVSLTKDLEPTKDSKWMVIKSIEGGCPVNAEGNLPENPDGSGSTEFKYTIPDGIEPGKYTLAWTWFNRIGNREMYMNCAPVTVKGGSSAKRSPVKRDASFPDLFVANVNGCTTPEGKDIRFPNPGEEVEYAGDEANLAAEGSEACTGTPSFGGSGNTPASGGSSGGSSDEGSGDEGSAPAPAPTTAPAPAPSAPADGGVFAPTTQPAADPAPTQPAAGGDSTGASGAQSGACTSEGQWNCIDGSNFQRCANGQWTPAQPMAGGTQCTPGQAAELAVAALKPRMLSEMRHRKRAHGAHRHA
ncbi:hypothetical protein P170DRAFT_422879 [Aspergillus steynii IBT 23096]|uniref:Lytic polysaccharide monooxygenase n=1 Tax=Aspergillus steynii IBT 23096 TaxID=1392250 RepID=A0A2I2GGD4_9EURO|nr:uncharacterized protein P170DRAFT_422879 [Aspergillus steynii IBT 23096]PLB51949.1 hypothetical protein P170DRAFT_422879 [Aspergillus steynii IBT 23096]